MNQVGFAPAVSLNAVRITIAALIAAAALAVVMFSPATASADGSASCTKILVNVACLGNVNGIPVVINIGDVANATNNNVNVLSTQLSNVLQNFANPVVISEVNSVVQNTVNNWVTTITETTTKACSIVAAPPVTGGGSLVIGCS